MIYVDVLGDMSSRRVDNCGGTDADIRRNIAEGSCLIKLVGKSRADRLWVNPAVISFVYENPPDE